VQVPLKRYSVVRHYDVRSRRTRLLGICHVLDICCVNTLLVFYILLHTTRNSEVSTRNSKAMFNLCVFLLYYHLIIRYLKEISVS
jgi:hypothetical protein